MLWLLLEIIKKSNDGYGMDGWICLMNYSKERSELEPVLRKMKI